MTKHYIITSYDGAWTNTHDVVSGDSNSRDSALLKKLITSHPVAGVYGCTHREPGGYAGFLKTTQQRRIENLPHSSEEEIAKQKLSAIHQRLADFCETHGVPFYGTSTKYDHPGLFTDAALISEIENSAAQQQDSDLSHITLYQSGKNTQLVLIIQDIIKREQGNNEPIVIHFYDDKKPVHDAIPGSHVPLIMLPHMQFNSYLYKLSSTQPTPAIFPIQNRIKGIRRAPGVAAARTAPDVSEEGLLNRLGLVGTQEFDYIFDHASNPSSGLQEQAQTIARRAWTTYKNRPGFFAPYQNTLECVGGLAAPVIYPVAGAFLSVYSLIAAPVTATAGLLSLLGAGVSSIQGNAEGYEAGLHNAGNAFKLAGIALLTAAVSLTLGFLSFFHSAASLLTRSLVTLAALIPTSSDGTPSPGQA